MSILNNCISIIEQYNNGITHVVETFYHLMEIDIDVAFKFKEENHITQTTVDEWKEGQRVAQCYITTDIPS